MVQDKLAQKTFQKSSRPQRWRRVAGFTLIENLVALAVLGVAATVYLRMADNLADSSRDVQDTVLAENLIMTLSNDLMTDAFRYPTLPTEIYDERLMSASQVSNGTDSAGKLSPDRFLRSFVRNKCNYRYMAFRCYDVTGALEFSCVVARDGQGNVKFKTDNRDNKKGQANCSCPASDASYNPMNLISKGDGEAADCADPYEYVCFDGQGNALHGIDSYFTDAEKAGFKRRYGINYPANGTYEKPSTCSKTSVRYFKSAVHDLSLRDDDVLSRLPMYRLNFQVEYKKTPKDVAIEFFFSRLATEVNRY